MEVALLRDIAVGHAHLTAAPVRPAVASRCPGLPTVSLQRPFIKAKRRHQSEAVDLTANLRYHDDGLIK
ncbi:hypothetical protein N7E70_002985 [Aminobacter sp. NyZ550]|uniref:Uncharacterized protein n=1 Tax=Aminobacter ciceronei TaxID=150723 RepID=A0ABR6C9Q6_9HYPH|nr:MULTISPECIES: hypothetical protein [Aminobacter]MBA8907434.1 hypothetical protein [Aminobacter ciceronei]MBA9021207.1 hypothetical protein [Aminobacter ciceronei]WAX95858.1 hypothetical protein N7E70_002985 [Aminobacter sp. NyZ550]WMC97115.1 hypothetical protein RAR13_27875 [Aminobacter aminovorans]